MEDFEKKLRENLEGEVRFDRLSRTIYSVDASIYEIEPVGVVIPRTRQDLITAVTIAHEFEVPIIARGGATGIAGGCIGTGLVIDTTKYLNKILHIDYDNEIAICEPGVVQDQLNNALADQGYRLGPDTSTGNRATLGGMLGNNAAGARSLRYGMMVDHLLETEVILANGEAIRLKALNSDELKQKSEQNNPEGQLYREMQRILQEFGPDIEKDFPKLPRRASGYNLDHVINKGNLNLAKLMAGSEGTLGIASEITVRIAKRPVKTGICLLHFENMIDALRYVPYYLNFKPLSLEMIDHQIMKMGRLSPSMRGRLDWLQGEPEALFIVEFDGNTDDEVKEKIDHFEKTVDQDKTHYALHHFTKPEEMENVWALRKAGLGLLLSRRTYSRAIGFLEDVAVAPEHLGDFMEKFLGYLNEHNKQAGVYGHVGAGCVHVRPFVNLRKGPELELMYQMMVDVADLLLEHGGTLSGEHGDGLVRSWLNEKMFGKKLYRAFCETKAAFDPLHRMNPGKVVHAPDLLQDLRADPETPQDKIQTFFDFSREGGFELSADLCNGNGQCRSRSGLMCPSFQAYGDELHTTRARAQMLRAIVNGRVEPEAFVGPELYKVLEYCLECKGCKTECPSQVDMAKMKSEFLYHYQNQHGATRRSKLFASIARASQMASKAPHLANWWIQSWPHQKFLHLLGIATERAQPLFAHERFSKWLSKQSPLPNPQKQVVLFNDTYTEFNFPEIGQAAYHVLSKLGFEVIVPQWQCCGRPLISKGFLKKAKRQAENLVETLYEYAKDGVPIVGLEPSCISALRDDYRDLISRNMTRHVADVVRTIDEFLNELIEKDEFQLSFERNPMPVMVHGHCHQKALVGTQPTLNVLKAVPGFKVTEIPSGCCGLAGSFGYEAEHYAMSMAIGEDRLFPAIRSAPEGSLFIANGLSCRSQIKHGTGAQAIHLVEGLSRCLS